MTFCCFPHPLRRTLTPKSKVCVTVCVPWFFSWWPLSGGDEKELTKESAWTARTNLLNYAILRKPTAHPQCLQAQFNICREREERERGEKEEGENIKNDKWLRTNRAFVSSNRAVTISQKRIDSSEADAMRECECVKFVRAPDHACLGGGFGLVYVSVLLKIRTTVRRAV